ncbi:MAG: phage baseplate assembly protein, partial [Alphaproteobacteria bacterium]|nr:phage baseplate assembly protein [Alphaproteobacteria bacterium]
MTNLNAILSRLHSLVTKAKIAALTLNGKVFEFDVNLANGDGHSSGELMVHHGVFSRPPLGTTAVILFPRGDKNLGIAVATRGKNPPAKVLSEAEAALYSASGDFVMLDGKGGAVINLAAMMSVVATSLK